MINEVFEAKEYIDGKNINKRGVYRMCYVLAKYYLDQGYDTLDARDKIFEWAKEHGIYIASSLSSIVYKASVDGVKLRGDVSVRISKQDVEEIKRRFDTKNTRMIALAMLCYGKVAASENGECSVSCLALSNWIGIDYSHLMGRYMPQMLAFRYISKIEPKKNRWVKQGKCEVSKFMFHVSLKNEGEYELVDNNLSDLYDRVFVG